MSGHSSGTTLHQQLVSEDSVATSAARAGISPVTPSGSGDSLSGPSAACCHRVKQVYMLAMVLAAAAMGLILTVQIDQAEENRAAASYPPPPPLCYADTYSGPSELTTVPCSRHGHRAYQNVTRKWNLTVTYRKLPADSIGPRQKVKSILLIIVEDNRTLALYDSHERTNSITHPIQWVALEDLATAARPLQQYHFKFDLFIGVPSVVPQLYSYPGFNSSEYCPDWATHGTYWSGWALTQSFTFDGGCGGLDQLGR